MTLATQPGSTDLHLPAAEPGEVLDPYTVHTYYFGISVPEARVGAFIYLRAQPGFPLSQGGLVAFRGLDNRAFLDAEFHDYRATMPWPDLDGNVVRTANGLTITVEEPGERIRVQFSNAEADTRLDVVQQAISPLVARGHIVPGEEDHHGAAAHPPGGIEQFMHATGELTLRGERHVIDCLAVRDRSWSQIRTEPPGGAKPTPPIGWTPIAFGAELCLNVTSVEDPATDPAWLGVCDPPGGALHYSGWISHKGELRGIAAVRREVSERHPTQHVATRQHLEITDDAGEVHRFSGEALAVCPIYAWPNIVFHDSVYRWSDEHGRTTHCTYQEIWHDDYQRAMTARGRRVGAS